MSAEKIKSRFYIEGPRWAGIASALRQGAFLYPELTLSLEEDKGFLTTVVYARVEGPRALVEMYLRAVDEAIAPWR